MSEREREKERDCEANSKQFLGKRLVTNRHIFEETFSRAFRVLEVHATRLRRLQRTKGSARKRERERERYIRIEKERKRKDDDERVFLRIFSVFEFEFSVVGDDSEDENDSDL